MFDRILLSTVVSGGTPVLSIDERKACGAPPHPQSIDEFRQRLAASPATFVCPFFTAAELPQLQVEWQSVFDGVGTAYLRSERRQVAICLLLSGRHATAEAAELEALEPMVAADPDSVWRSAFRALRRQQRRPLLVILDLASQQQAEQLAITLAGECLAAAFFAPHRVPKHVAPV